MKQGLFFLLINILLISCGPGNETQVKAVTTDTAQSVNTNELSGCYLLIIGKDTARLQLEKLAASVKGRLSYKRYEKDSNDGIIEGSITNEFIKGWYRFQSEGMFSVREIRFKITDNKLLEGYGDMGQHNDTAYFKYPTALQYEEKHPYSKVSCN